MGWFIWICWKFQFVLILGWEAMAARSLTSCAWASPLRALVLNGELIPSSGCLKEQSPPPLTSATQTCIFEMNKPRAGLINYVTEQLSYYTKKIPASRNNEISIPFDRIVAFWFKECPLLTEKFQRFYLNGHNYTFYILSLEMTVL